MGRTEVQAMHAAAWRLARCQHDVIARRQLLELGFHRQAIAHRIQKGRLHAVWRGVYAVGRPTLTRYGRWMVAVLYCGPGATLSNGSAAALLGVGSEEDGLIEVTIPPNRRHRHPGLLAHRREMSAISTTTVERIPVTDVVQTLLDLASARPPAELEAAVGAADRLDLIDPETLRRRLRDRGGQPGVAALRTLLDENTFVLTHTELERLFVPLALSAGLSPPDSQRWLGGGRVDFVWAELGLVVETDGLRYHRTAAQQARDILRDNAHVAAGRTPVRFSHAQVRFKPNYVRAQLAAIAAAIRARQR